MPQPQKSCWSSCGAYCLHSRDFDLCICSIHRHAIGLYNYILLVYCSSWTAVKCFIKRCKTGLDWRNRLCAVAAQQPAASTLPSPSSLSFLFSASHFVSSLSSLIPIPICHLFSRSLAARCLLKDRQKTWRAL